MGSNDTPVGKADMFFDLMPASKALISYRREGKEVVAWFYNLSKRTTRTRIKVQIDMAQWRPIQAVAWEPLTLDRRKKGYNNFTKPTKCGQ